VRYGALIRYYDLDNQPDGDWVDFFLRDPVMIQASLASLDLVALRANYERMRNETARARGAGEKMALLGETFGCILALAQRIDGWLAAAGDNPVRQQIAAAIDGGLRSALQRLKAYDLGAASPEALDGPVGLDYDAFQPLWQLGFVCPDPSIYRGTSKSRRINHALGYLELLFNAFADAMAELRSFARANLETTLFTGDHRPQIALYIAFVRLFANAQRTINAFSSRYAEFYERRVLREPYAGPLPDSVYLAFTLTDGAVRSTVPRGALFTAPDKVLYAAERALTVTAATITALRTLRVIHEPLFGDVPRRVVTEEIPPQAKKPWQTFGDADSGIAAEFGFAIASQELLLGGGTRTVTIGVAYNDPKLAARLETLERLTGLEARDILSLTLAKAFTLQASTTEHKWFPIDSYEALVSDDGRFALRFTLPPSAPPIEPAGNDPPAIKAWLRQEAIELSGPHGSARIYPLSLLATMEVAVMEIDVEVEDVATLTLHNSDGPISAKQAFSLFGAQPAAGSYLRIGNRELFTKIPHSLRITVHWFKLPPNSDGFKGYYRDYSIGLSGRPEPHLFDNAVFRAHIGVLEPGAWDVAQHSPLCLFRTTNDCSAPKPLPDGTLCPATRFDALHIAPTGEQPSFYDPAAASIVVRLAEPPYAFGHILYARNVVSAVTNQGDLAACQEKCLALCLPFRRVAQRIGECITGSHGSETSLAACLESCADDLQRASHDTRNKNGPQEVVDHLNDFANALFRVLSGPAGDVAPGALTVKKNLEAAYAMHFDACMKECLQPKKELKYPNAPWVPMAESVRVDYTARSRELKFTHLAPFGDTHDESLPSTLLPTFPYEGELRIGLSGVTSPEALTLLFSMTPGGDWNDPAPPVWETLSRDPLLVLSDTTNALQDSGIVTLSLPANTEWIRAVVPRDADRFPRTAIVLPHALTASWHSGGAENRGNPLPAGKIKAAAEFLPFIETVAQPLESFDGRPPETLRPYQTRLGERLRHKERAILEWDYERLVLERFPSVWKAQALPARDRDGSEVPGSVLMVIVPAPGTHVDPTAPRAPKNVLTQIERFLRSRVSPFVNLRVVNPTYIRVTVTATVRFSDVDDAGDNIARLNDDLVRYLSPWFYDAARAAKPDRYFAEADISDFIQTRHYVATLIDIAFSYTPDRNGLQ